MVGDKVLLRRLVAKASSDGGILIPEQLRVPQDFALVIAIGPGNIKGDGGRSTMTARIGDMVPLPKRVFGQPIKVDDVDYIICREFEIPMLLRDEPIQDVTAGTDEANKEYEKGITPV